MDTKHGGIVPQNLGKRQLPEFAFKIRELRKGCKLTQARFASKLGTTRTTVARWETGTREPGAENYGALGRFAQQKSLDSSAFFFERERADKISLQDRVMRRSALETLEAIEQDAALGREPAKRLLAEAEKNPADVRKQYRKTLEGISNGLYRAVNRDLATIEDIWVARELRAGKIAEAHRRLSKRLLASQKQRLKDLSEIAVADKAILKILTAKIKLFLDELSATGCEIIAKQRIMAAHDELSPTLRELGGGAESQYAAKMLEALEHAARVVKRAETADDIHAAVASLQYTLNLKPPMPKENV